MAEVTFRHFEKLGAPEWSEEAKVFARELQKSLAVEPMQEPFFEGLGKLTPPWEAEKAFRAQLPAWQLNYAADDYVDYTWHAPTVRLYVGRPTLQAPKSGYRYPEWVGMRWEACRPASIRCGARPRRYSPTLSTCWRSSFPKGASGVRPHGRGVRGVQMGCASAARLQAPIGFAGRNMCGPEGREWTVP
jgi:aminobenzoyl-glutamate utilization protein B